MNQTTIITKNNFFLIITININGKQIPQQLLNGRLNIKGNGARIEIIPGRRGLRFEQKIIPKNIAPKRR